MTRVLSITIALLLTTAPAVAQTESGRVIAIEGLYTAVLADGRRVGLTGLDVRGLTDVEAARLRAAIEVYLLDRDVEFRDVYRTGFGKLAGAPVWRSYDVVGTLLRGGYARFNRYGVTASRAARWESYAGAARTRRTGVWAAVATPSTRILRTPQATLQGVYRGPVFPVGGT